MLTSANSGCSYQVEAEHKPVINIFLAFYSGLLMLLKFKSVSGISAVLRWERFSNRFNGGLHI